MIADSDVFYDYNEEVPDNDDWQESLGVEKTPKENLGPEKTTNNPSASRSTKINLFKEPSQLFSILIKSPRLCRLAS